MALAEGEPPAEVLPGVAQALQALRRRERLMDRTGLMVVRDLPDDRLDAGLAAAGFRAVTGDPDMVMELPETGSPTTTTWVV